MTDMAHPPSVRIAFVVPSSSASSSPAGTNRFDRLVVPGDERVAESPLLRCALFGRRRQAPCAGPPAQQRERFFVRVARNARLSKRQHGDGPQNGGAAVAEVMEFE
jgi:hypothetical protein